MILPGTRLLLVIFSGLTLLAFAVLFGLADATERGFAWTIKPPATAAFLGAAYAAGCVLVVLALRKGTWAALRIPFLTILVFTIVTLAATLLHLDRLHFSSDIRTARYAAYFWMGVYLLVPPAMVAVLVVQERRPSPAPDPLPMPSALAATLLVQGLLLVAVAAALFVVPGAATALWPWPLTPLTARVVAAWLLAFGLCAVLAWHSRDLARLDVAAWAYGLLAVLEVVVIIRFAGTVEWSAPAIWVYLAVAASIMVSSVFALVRLRRPPQRERLGRGEQAADTVVQ
jgi:hypothetical protein